MGSTEKDELREISKLLELENIHISEENSRATYVGKLNLFMGKNQIVTTFDVSVNDKDLTNYKLFSLK